MFGQLHIRAKEYIQATSKGSDQTARMRRLVWAFAGRTYHIVGNLMLPLKKMLNQRRWRCIDVDSTLFPAVIVGLVYL